MKNKKISCSSSDHNFQASKDQNEKVILFCTKCGEIRSLELVKEEGAGEVG